MSAIIFQIEAIRKLTRREWMTTDHLLSAVAALKELVAEVERTLSNRLECEAELAWQRGDWL
jgi:hypothetical protein